MTVWKWSGESRYPGALPPMLENFSRAFSPGPTDCPWVSEDAPILLHCTYKNSFIAGVCKMRKQTAYGGWRTADGGKVIITTIMIIIIIIKERNE